MQENTAHRIQRYIDYKKMSNRAFELKAGLSNGYIQTMIKQKGNIGIKTISKIIEAFPDINLNFLITGKGEVVIEEEKITEKKDYQDQLIEAQQKLIEKLERIEELQNDLKEIKKEERKNYGDYNYAAEPKPKLKNEKKK